MVGQLAHGVIALAGAPFGLFGGEARDGDVCRNKPIFLVVGGVKLLKQDAAQGGWAGPRPGLVPGSGPDFAQKRRRGWRVRRWQQEEPVFSWERPQGTGYGKLSGWMFAGGKGQRGSGESASQRVSGRGGELAVEVSPGTPNARLGDTRPSRSGRVGLADPDEVPSYFMYSHRAKPSPELEESLSGWAHFGGVASFGNSPRSVTLSGSKI